MSAPRSAPRAAGGGLLQGLFGGGKTAKGGAAAGGGGGVFADGAPTWEELARRVSDRRDALGVAPTPPLEDGPTSPLALKRTFGSAEAPRVKLYRDHAAWCPYCEKIWLQLEEKRIPYTIEKINMRCYGEKAQSYLAKCPAGLLPAMELDGQLFTESEVIQQVLEESFPNNTPLIPQAQRKRHQQLMQLERALFGRWMQWLTSSWSDGQGREGFVQGLDAVDGELAKGGGPYFLGAELSLVDLTFAPFMERMAASLVYYKGFIMRGEGRWPHVEAWFDAMESRPTFANIKSDYYTHAHDLPPQLGGCAFNDSGPAFAAQIDGTDGTSWTLPLAPLTATSLEPVPGGDHPALDRLEAAAKLVENHDAVVRFSARATGKPGTRRYGAPLADPTASPWEDDLPAADAALRHVAAALLREDEDIATADALQLATGPEALSANVAAEALAYLRDRVGVPRDLHFPAARQLRAHLNWAIDSLNG